MTPAACIELAQRLEELGKVATAGPWKRGDISADDWGLIRGGDGKPVLTTAMMARYVQSDCGKPRGPEPLEANADLCALLRNNLPLILGSLRGLAVAVEALYQIETYGHDQVDRDMAEKANTAIAGLVGGGG